MCQPDFVFLRLGPLGLRRTVIGLGGATGRYEEANDLNVILRYTPGYSTTGRCCLRLRSSKGPMWDRRTVRLQGQ